jgi:hypothetical protein
MVSLPSILFETVMLEKVQVCLTKVLIIKANNSSIMDLIDWHGYPHLQVMPGPECAPPSRSGSISSNGPGMDGIPPGPIFMSKFNVSI